jgi:hypothetical protein
VVGISVSGGDLLVTITPEARDRRVGEADGSAVARPGRTLRVANLERISIEIRDHAAELRAMVSR